MSNKKVRLARLKEMPGNRWPVINEVAHGSALTGNSVPIKFQPHIDLSKYPPDKLREIRRAQTLALPRNGVILDL